MSLNRRTVLKGALATERRDVRAESAGRGRAGRPDQGRLSHREIRRARLRRAADGTGHADVLQGAQQHARRPPGRAADRRHRRQSGAGAHQDAGAGRALRRACADRPARRLRGAGDRRLHQLLQDADPHRRGRRGHDPAQAEPVAGAPELDLGAAEPSDGRLRGQGAEAQARDRDRGRLRVRPRERRGLPARIRGWRRQGGAEDLHPAQRARLRHLCVAIQERRLPLHRPRRLERPEADPPARRIRPQGQVHHRRRLHADRRIGAAADGRRRRRLLFGLLVFGRARQSDQQEVRRRRSSATTRSIPASTRPRPICAARCSSTP